jgi:hypothetical protein
MRNLGMGPPPIDRPARKPRLGCMGCLTRVLLILVVGGILLVVMQGLFYPWSFYLGGHFHLLPIWQGVGHIQSPAGGYLLYFWIEPTRGGRVYNLPNFRGTGYLCTPRGERFRLRVYANMPEKTGTDSNGKPMIVEFRHRPWYYSFVGGYDARPRLHFRGKWQNPGLVTDDGGTFAGAFQANGNLTGNLNNYYHADSTHKIQVVFHETTGWHNWWNDCRAAR